jgi:hypothetical protein
LVSFFFGGEAAFGQGDHEFDAVELVDFTGTGPWDRG